jgi:hypothetical protein
MLDLEAGFGGGSVQTWDGLFETGENKKQFWPRMNTDEHG